MNKNLDIDLVEGDCLIEMQNIPDKSVDMILCDLPYGTTACKWDVVIPFDKLWEQYKRVIKDNGAIVLFGSEPFSSHLRMSNLKWYKYDWVWNKKNANGHVRAKVCPMKKHELISVFSPGAIAPGSTKNMIYYPQGLLPLGKVLKGKREKKHENSPARKSFKESYVQEWTNYPNAFIEFVGTKNDFHPTQKPVPLLEYLIKTYTLESETVLDNCMGSGSTGVACVNLNRKFIGIEKEEKYFKIAQERIQGIKHES